MLCPQIGYGTTENSPVTFCGATTDNMDRKSETVGFIIDHLEVTSQPQRLRMNSRNCFSSE